MNRICIIHLLPHRSFHNTKIGPDNFPHTSSPSFTAVGVRLDIFLLNWTNQPPHRYAFDTKPEATRPYISFQPSQRIVVEKRHDCGWWTGAVIEDEQHGNLGPKGYFPGNYCQEQAPAQPVAGGNPQTAT